MNILIFIVGVIVGYMLCMYLWIKELSEQIHDAQMKIIEWKGEMHNDE